MPNSPSPQQNCLLAALSVDVQKRLFPYLELTFLRGGEVLYKTGEKLRNVYFPIDGIVSQMNIIESGASLGISMVGNEGLVGVALIMGDDITSNWAIVQTAGNAYRLSGKHLKDELKRHGDVLSLMLLYAQVEITQLAQTAVCNRHHSIEQQLCRCLLMCLDRSPSNLLILTQQKIANSLGVRREGISDAAGKLQKLGIIACGRGHIIVLNRSRLERLSCECYSVVKKEMDRLLPCPPVAVDSRQEISNQPYSIAMKKSHI